MPPTDVPMGWKGPTVPNRLPAHVHSTSPSSLTPHANTAMSRLWCGCNPTLGDLPIATPDLSQPHKPLTQTAAWVRAMSSTILSLLTSDNAGIAGNQGKEGIRR